MFIVHHTLGMFSPRKYPTHTPALKKFTHSTIIEHSSLTNALKQLMYTHQFNVRDRLPSGLFFPRFIFFGGTPHYTRGSGGHWKRETLREQKNIIGGGGEGEELLHGGLVRGSFENGFFVYALYSLFCFSQGGGGGLLVLTLLVMS